MSDRYTIYPGLDHVANFMNSLDTSDMTAKDVRKAIHMECLDPTIIERPPTHYCKHCDATFRIRIPVGYTGDAIIQCNCGAQHPRQFESGIAVSCDAPTSRPMHILPVDGSER